VIKAHLPQKITIFATSFWKRAGPRGMNSSKSYQKRKRRRRCSSSTRMQTGSQSGKQIDSDCYSLKKLGMHKICTTSYTWKEVKPSPRLVSIVRIVPHPRNGKRTPARSRSL
jgi:hypothetical protein